MRRGGRGLLLIGILIAAAAAGLLFFYLNTLGGPSPQVGQPGAFTAEPTPEPLVPIVVAAADIPAGQVITETETLLRIEQIPQSKFNRTQHFASIGEVSGKLTLRAITEGDQITKDAITEPGLSQQVPLAEQGRPRDKAIPVQVDASSGVADQVKLNDFVDIVATFTFQRRVSLPGPITEQTVGGQTLPVETRTFELVDVLSTKTLIQRAQVLRIVRPPPPPPKEGEAPPAQPETTPAQPPTSGTDASGKPIQETPAQTQQGANITPGEWILVLALNDQESELLEYARAAGARVTLVLRGAGDTDFEPTTGATLDLLIGEFGLPLPEPVQPYSYGKNVLDPQPTRTPAPTRVP